jgi:hypothetical protein
VRGRSDSVVTSVSFAGRFLVAVTLGPPTDNLVSPGPELRRRPS